MIESRGRKGEGQETTDNKKSPSGLGKGFSCRIEKSFLKIGEG